MRVWDCEEREYAVFTAVVKFEFGDGRSKVPGGSPAAAQRVSQFVVAVQTLDCRVGSVDPELGGDLERLHEDEAALGLGSPELLKDCSKGLARGFREVNCKPARLDAKRIRVQDLEVVGVEQSTYARAERPDHRRGHWQRFPRSQGISVFSRVGFSADGAVAVVSRSTMQGQFGWGDIYLLRWENGEWRVVGRELSWVT
jgi:hypothetical protein